MPREFRKTRPIGGLDGVTADIAKESRVEF